MSKIPACPKDCMLYWGEENESLEECKNSAKPLSGKIKIRNDMQKYCVTFH